MRIRSKLLIFSFVMLCCFRVNPLTVGASSLVSVEPVANFPTISNTSNRILQFAFMQNGFTLADASTTCTFGAVFPVAGNVNMRGGLLYFDTDLIFQNPARLISGGYFWGSNHQLDLSSSMTWLSSTNNTSFRNISVFLNNDFTIAGTVKFLGSCLLDGRFNNLTLGQNANIVVGHNANLVIRNIEIDGLLGYKIKCLDDTASFTLDNVRLVQTGNYTFTRGAISFVNSIDIVGQRAFNFSPTRTSTIESDATLYFDIGTTLNYSPQVAKKNLLFMRDASSFLSLNGCTLTATRTGLQLSNGTLILDNHVTFSSRAQFLAEGIELRNSLNTVLLGSAFFDLFGFINAN